MLHYQIWTGNEEEKRGGGTRLKKIAFVLLGGGVKQGRKGGSVGMEKRGMGESNFLLP